MRSPAFRLRFLSFVVVILALLLASRLYLVQIVSGDDLKRLAENQYVENESFFDRGYIYFTSKEGKLVPGASIKSGYTLYINPTILSKSANLENIYKEINAITPIDKEEFIAKASKEKDPYEELAKRLPEEVATRIKAKKMDGVQITKNQWRFYPGESIAAHTLGLIGFQGDTLAGRYGLERFYEPVLERTSGEVFVNFFAEIFSNIRSAVKAGDGLEGNIVTTIEPTVETYLEGEIRKVNQKYSSDFTGGIIIDPVTGEIVSMALYPTFDPNSPQSEKSSDVFRNRFVEDRYEMGSIVKALTYAIGLDEKVITSRTTYNDPGCQTLNTKKFCNYDAQSHGTHVSMQTALNKSLNTGAAYVALKVGSKKFNDRMLGFGLDTLTDIDLPSEGKSLVSNLKTTRELEAAQASFGQGIALTPINTVRALSALANGGTLITPHLVKDIKYKIGTSKALDFDPPEDRKRVLSAEASTEISRMLTEVVDRSLRDGTVRLEHYSVAAKTGTAQIAKPGGAGYYDDRYLHSFFGYFPSYEPRFLIFLYTYYPKGVSFASETLTDTFINTTKFLINYYNIPPDREVAPPAPR